MGIATDRFMSGWGQAPRTSYVAYPLDKLNEQGRERKLMHGLENVAASCEYASILSCPACKMATT